MPDAARRVRDHASELGGRALEVAIDRDHTFRDRYDETGLRARLHDATLLAERVALAMAADEPDIANQYAEWTTALYRRARVPMDDLIALCEGLRRVLPTILSDEEMGSASAALDAAIAAYRWHRRIAGDARRRNRFLQFIYKGG
jgi:1,6-anhydro-N-acetylmuramate kinase